MVVQLSPQAFHISTHALHEEGDIDSSCAIAGRYISTHALHEEGDLIDVLWIHAFFIFLPTPSTRRATLVKALKRLLKKWISTHALHEEGDPANGDNLGVPQQNINPPTPRGGQHS